MKALRQEAEEYAKKILKDKKLSKKELAAKEKIVKKFKSAKHVLLKQKDVDHCINNNMDVMYLYDELLSKYGGFDDVEKPKKQYYVPTGAKRGRPKQEG
jgi:hypothetical protein